MKLLCLSSLLVLLSVTLIAGAPGSERLDPPLDDLLGAWVGYEKGGTYFYYLVLEKNGSGRCEVLFADGTVDSYTIKRWRMKAGKLSLEVSPLTKSAEEIRVTVNYFDPLSMDLTISGATGEWSRSATVYKESELTSRIEKCRRHSNSVLGREPNERGKHESDQKPNR
jgi:hypothetical protein